MTTLTATAVITAVDRASAVFARVGASAHAIGGRFAAAAGGLSRFGQAAAMNLGMPAALAGSYAAHGEYEVDRLARLMQSAGEITDDQRRKLVDSSFAASQEAGLQAQEIIKGLREVILGGFGAEEAAGAAGFLSMAAKANGASVEAVAEDGITMATALGFAMDTAAERTDSMRRALEFVSVVQAKSPESWEGLTTAMKYAAPIATALKMDIGELGAALSLLSFAGFKGEESGTALRTIMTRLVAPTRAARNQIRAAGIELENIANIDTAKLGDMTSLKERLLGAGLGQGVNLDRVLKGFSDPNAFGGVYRWNDELFERLREALDIKRGDSQSRDILQKSLQAHISNAINGVDIEKTFRGLSTLTLPAMKDLFGLQRIAQAEALRKKLQELLELPDGQRVSKFHDLAEEMKRTMPGAIERRFAALNVGFAQSIDRIGASLGALRHSIFDSGFGTGLADLFERLASSIKSLSETNPEILQAVGWGLAGLAVAPAVGFTIMGITAALEGLAAMIGGPALMGLLAAGGIAALFGDVGSLTQAGENGISPLGELVRGTLDLGQQLGLAFADAASAVQALYASLRELAGLSLGYGVLIDSVRNLAETLQYVADLIKFVREAGSAMMGGNFSPDIDVPESLKSGRSGILGGLGLVPGGAGAALSATRPMIRSEDGSLPFGGQSLLPPSAVAPAEAHVTGEATVKSDVTVRVLVPPGFQALVEQMRNGTAAMPLNSGQSMPDAGASGGQ